MTYAHGHTGHKNGVKLKFKNYTTPQQQINWNKLN